MRIAALVLGLWTVSTSLPLAEAQEPAGAARASGLTLFEAVETAESRNELSPGRPARESRATTAEPEFTLLGTSRIGGSYSAMMRHRTGDTVMVKSNPDGNAQIRDHAGFSIVEISSGVVSVVYPDNVPCIEFRDRGVRCNVAGNIAELVLTNSEPLPSANPTAVNRGENASDEVIENLNTDPGNPFDALRNAQNARATVGGDGNPAGGRFTPRRIRPEDVPEGMRVVATPFGDRLVDL